MRSSFLVLLLGLAVGGTYLVQSRQVRPPAAASATPAPGPNTHNWPKNALDRVDEVKQQVAQQRKAHDAE